MDAEGKPKSWITVNGNHIPVFEGETKKESVKNFLGKARRSDVIKKFNELGFEKDNFGRYNIPDAGVPPIDVEEQISAFKKFFNKEDLEALIAKKETPHPVPNSPEAKQNVINAMLARIAFQEEYDKEPDIDRGNNRNEETRKKYDDFEREIQNSRDREQLRREEISEQIDNLKKSAFFSDRSQKQRISDDFVQNAIFPSNRSHKTIIGEPLSQREERLLRDYTGPAFDKLNRMVREGKNNREISILNDVISKHETTEPLILFRGVRGSGSLKPSGFVSSTTDFETARKYSGYGNGQIYELHLPKGSSAISVRDVSQSPEEEEILLPIGTRFRIKGYRKIGTDLIEVVEVQTPKKQKKS